MTEWEKAAAGVFYQANHDPEIIGDLRKWQERNYEYNMLRPSQMEERREMIRKYFGKVGEHFHIEQPFYGDHWNRIRNW